MDTGRAVVDDEEMTAHKPYPSYRKTDLPWLAQIPAHWEVTNVKRGYEIRLGKMLRPEPATSSDTLEPYLRAANVQWQDVNTDNVKEMWFSQWEKPLYELRSGDLMVCEGGDVGRASIWQGQLEKCYIQNSIHRVRNREGFVNKFLYYWLIVLKNSGYIDLLCNKATIAHFTADKFASIELIVPPLPEQQAIAAYLDRQTAKIDALIAKKQRLLELLAEQRAALISQAVTKGLNPDVKMKDSGMESLGKVPEHWNVKRMKYISTEYLQYGANESAEIDDPSLPRFIRITDIREDGTLRDETFKSLPEEVAQPFLLKYGDILFARSGATVGKSFMYRESWGKSCYAGYLIRVRVNPKIAKPEFVSYFANSSLYWNWISNIFIKATIQNVSAEKYGNLLLPIPSLSEQEEIVDYLDYQSKRLSDLAAKVETAIERLHEYRAALISSVVTGKVQVKDE
jgi:restriction endonuclease S subunit